VIRTFDAEYIHAILKHPAIWPWAMDDGLDRETWCAPINSVNHWLRPQEGGALFLTYAQDPLVWEAHSAVLPEHRAKTVEFYKWAFDYVRHNTPCKCLIGKIAEGNYRAKRAAEAAGMKFIGTLPKACQRRGLRDVAIYALEI
jgi:RimJ/RimL family protein N-acetyltransferase